MRVTVRLFARLRDIAGAAEMLARDSRRARRSERVDAARRRVSRHWRTTSARFRARRERRLRADGRRGPRRRRDRVSAARIRRMITRCSGRERVDSSWDFMFDKLAADRTAATSELTQPPRHGRGAERSDRDTGSTRRRWPSSNRSSSDIANTRRSSQTSRRPRNWSAGGDADMRELARKS